MSRLTRSARRAACALVFFTAAASSSAESIPGRIAFSGVDHQIYVADPNGGTPRSLTGGEEPGRMTFRSAVRAVSALDDRAREGPIRFSYPTWAPDGETLLALGARMSGDAAVASGIYRLRADRAGVITPVFEDSRRTAIYAFWDPTGRSAGVLFTEEEGIGLAVIDVGEARLRSVASGLPFYFAWRNDGRTLLAHVGGSSRDNPAAKLSRIELGPPAERRDPKIETIAERPAGFRAPAWAPDGRRFAYASFTDEEGGSSLFVQNDGRKQSLGPVSSRVVFGWTPQGDALTIAEFAQPGGSLFAGISLVRVADGRREPLYAGPLAAFFWAPDGGRLLVAAPDFDTGDWRWLVIDRETREVREVARFLPNPELQMVLLHFDQFALSHRLWAPDSRHFVFAAYPAGSGGSAGPTSPVVSVADAVSGTLVRIEDGRSAFWSAR